MQSRVLVVDDDQSACEFMRDVLNHATSMEVLILTESKAAADYLDKEKFAVILLDLRMPAPDGIELARQTRKTGLNHTTPIIMLSDDQSTAAIGQGFAAGANFFLYKPIDKTRLLRLARAAHGAIEYEKRRFRRVPLKTRVVLQFGDGREMVGETIDVSLNGILVKVADAIPTDPAVRVSLYPPNGGMPIIGSGSVVRMLSGNRCGIHLNRLPPSESSRLEEFLLPMIANDEKGLAEAVGSTN